MRGIFFSPRRQTSKSRIIAAFAFIPGFIGVFYCIFVLIFCKQLLEKYIDFLKNATRNATRFTGGIYCIYIHAAFFNQSSIVQFWGALYPYISDTAKTLASISMRLPSYTGADSIIPDAIDWSIASLLSPVTGMDSRQ